jgi:uncharacterized protein (TIGR01244 family)
MKQRTANVSAVVCLIALVASTALAQAQIRHKELPNFHKVSDNLYRGAQPLDRGLEKLAGLGIKTIINLRGEDERTSEEQKQAGALGLSYFSIPMPGLSAPSDEQVARVMAIIDKAENQPVFIHCKRGSDRTGTIAAIYRISHEGWTAERAITEAKQRGMSWTEFGMRDYISDYHKRQSDIRKTQPAAASATSKY